MFVSNMDVRGKTLPQNYIVICVLISIIIHGVVFLIPDNKTLNLEKKHARTGITVNIRAATAPEEEIVPDVASAVDPETVEPETKPVINNKEVALPQKEVTDIEPSPSNPQISFDLSLPESNFYNETGTDRTANGAVIFDRELRKSIVREQKVIRPKSNDSGGYAILGCSDCFTIVRIANKCFIVTEANPLDSLSQETWSRTRC